MVFQNTWTDEEIEYLSNSYPKQSILLKDICTKLNRSKAAVCHKAIRMGIRRPRSKDKQDRKEIERRYYLKNHSAIMEKRRARKRALRIKLIKMLGGECSEKGCNEKRHPCLDFHHNDKSKKKNDIATLVSIENHALAIKEAKKCVLLCANCHRMRHHEELIMGS